MSNVNNIKTNRRKGLIIATVENLNPAIVMELLAVTSLGPNRRVRPN